LPGVFSKDPIAAFDMNYFWRVLGLTQPKALNKKMSAALSADPDTVTNINFVV
jgi:hypothetical protein